MNPEQIKADVALAKDERVWPGVSLLKNVAAHCEALLTENERLRHKAGECGAGCVHCAAERERLVAALAGSPPEPGGAP